MIGKETTAQKSFREHVEVIIRRRWFFIIPAVAVVLLSLILGYVLPKTYQATTIIQVNNKKILEPLVAGIAVTPDAKEALDALSRQVVSWNQVLRLVRQLHLADNAGSQEELEALIGRIRKGVTITMKEGNILEISYESGNPATAQQVVNALTRNFIEQYAQTKKEDARGAIEFINEQLNIYRQKLGESQKNFSTHKVDADLRQLLNRKRLLENQLKSLQKTIPSQVRMEQNPVVSRLQSHLAELEMELSRLQMDAKEGNPRVIALKGEIDKIKASLDSEIRKETVRESISSVNPEFLSVQQEINQVNMEIEDLTKQKKEMAAAEDPPDKATTDEDLATLETSTKVDEDIYQMLLKQIESAYVSERLQDSEKGSAFRVLEYARLPATPIKPDRNKVLLAGLFLSLMAGLGGVFSMEYLDRSFRTADDAKKHLKMQFLGSTSKIVVESGEKPSLSTRVSTTLKKYLQKHKFFSELRFVSPHIAKRVPNSAVAPQIVIYHEPKSPVSEEYRIIRTNIQGLSYESTIHTLMVTSSVRGEGKSTTSMNIAISMADIGRNTLLMDCDLRKGVSHELLSVSPSPGLSDVLGKGVDIDAALVQTRIKNLTLLPCGSRPINPSELLGSSRMEKLLNSFKTGFDVIIMDAPPVLNLPDASILGRSADAVLLVVQAERTQREDIINASAMLAQAHSNIVGFVLTNVQYYIPKYVYDYLYGT